MHKVLVLTTLLVCLFAAGCSSTKKINKGHEGGESYVDVPVPANYEDYDTPPFKRQDSEGGRRIYGRYAYKSTDGIDSAREVTAWFTKNLPAEGWEFQTEDVDENKGTATVRFKKGDEQLKIELSPDERVSGSERFSVLVIEMNPQYD
ncbi:MAG: hypothetical protein K8I27_10820 [Planctomycetes bacterium]|nr:hypothetical protein [Planctomycetota bacterium]